MCVRKIPQQLPVLTLIFLNLQTTRPHAERPPCLTHPTYPAQVSECIYTPEAMSLSGCTGTTQYNEDTPPIVSGTLPSPSPILPLGNALLGHVGSSLSPNVSV